MTTLALVLSLAAAAPRVLDIQIYTFDRTSGEMAPIDPRARPTDYAGDLIAIVRTGGGASTLAVSVMEGKKKRFTETRTVSGGAYEMFFLRTGMLCAPTTVTATVTKGRARFTRSALRLFACEANAPPGA